MRREGSITGSQVLRCSFKATDGGHNGKLKTMGRTLINQTRFCQHGCFSDFCRPSPKVLCKTLARGLTTKIKPHVPHHQNETRSWQVVVELFWDRLRPEGALQNSKHDLNANWKPWRRTRVCRNGVRKHVLLCFCFVAVLANLSPFADHQNNGALKLQPRAGTQPRLAHYLRKKNVIRFDSRFNKTQR